MKACNHGNHSSRGRTYITWAAVMDPTFCMSSVYFYFSIVDFNFAKSPHNEKDNKTTKVDHVEQVLPVEK